MVVLIVAYFALRHYRMNGEMALIYGKIPNVEVDGVFYYDGVLSCLDTTYVVLVGIGMILFSIFGTVGLIMIPYTYIVSFLYRPHQITGETFN